MSNVAIPLVLPYNHFYSHCLDEPITSKLLLSIVKFYVDFMGKEEWVFLAHHNYIYIMLLIVFINPLDSCLHGSSCFLHFLKTV